jgi:hypothetical protein
MQVAADDGVRNGNSGGGGVRAARAKRDYYDA